MTLDVWILDEKLNMAAYCIAPKMNCSARNTDFARRTNRKTTTRARFLFPPKVTDRIRVLCSAHTTFNAGLRYGKKNLNQICKYLGP